MFLLQASPLGSVEAKQNVPAAHQVNNTIVLASDESDGTYLHIQKIHTTIRPQERFVRQGETWKGLEPDWEGTPDQLQTIPANGRDWAYEVNGQRFPLADHDGFRLSRNYQGT